MEKLLVVSLSLVKDSVCRSILGREGRIILLCVVSVLLPNEDCWQTSVYSRQPLDTSYT